LVEWEDFSQEENMWVAYENVTEYEKESLKNYYAQNPKVEKARRFGMLTGKKEVIRKKVKNIERS